MANVLRLSDVADQALALAADSQLLADIGKLGSVWTQVSQAIAAAADDPTAAAATKLAWLLDNLDQPAVTRIFDTLQLPDLLASLRAAKARLVAVLPNATALLDPISANPPAVTWQPGTLDGKLQPATDLSLSLALTGSLTVQAGAAWPFKGDNMADTLLLIGASGKLSTDAALALPFQYGKLGATAATSAVPSLQFFFWQSPSDPILATAAGKAIATLPDPFDPASVWNAFAHNDLAGLVMTFDGTTSVAVDLTLGKDLDLPNWVTGNLGATITVGLTRGSTYQFSVRAAARLASQFQNPTLILTLSRADNADTDWGLALGLDIDASPIFTPVHDFLADKLNAVDGIIGQITPYLSPGTWATQQAQGLLDGLVTRIAGNADVQAALSHDVALLLGKTPTGTDLADTIKGIVTTALNALGGSATTAADSAIDTLFGQMTTAIPALADTGVADRLKTDLADLIAQYQNALGDLAQTLLRQVPLADIETSLAKVGTTVAAAASQANQALAGIRAFISRYDALAAKIVAFTADKAKAKVSARITADSKRTRQSQYEVSGTFTSLAGSAGTLYHALAFGALSAVRQALNTTVPGFALIQDASSISQIIGRTDSFGYEFLLFGLDFTASDVLSAEAEITELPGGTINIGAKGSYDRKAQAQGTSRSLSFLTSYAMLRTRTALKTQQPTVRLSIAATQADSAITVGEVTSFLQALSTAGLISDARKTSITTQMARTAISRGTNANVAGTVTVTQNFTQADVQALQALGSPITDAKVASAAGLSIFTSGTHALYAAGALSASNLHSMLNDFSFRDGIANFRRQYPDDIEFTYQTILAYRATLQGLYVGQGSGGSHGVGSLPDPVIGQFFQAIAPLIDMIDLIATLAAQTAPTLGSLQSYQEAEARIAEDAAPWLKLNKSLLSFKAELHPRMVALFLLLGSLARGRAPDAAGMSYDDMFTVTLARDGMATIIV